MSLGGRCEQQAKNAEIDPEGFKRKATEDSAVRLSSWLLRRATGKGAK